MERIFLNDMLFRTYILSPGKDTIPWASVPRSKRNIQDTAWHGMKWTCVFLFLMLLAGCNTLNGAYDEGGPGQGRKINADAGAVSIDGPDGLTVESNVGIGLKAPEAKLHIRGRGDGDSVRVDQPGAGLGSVALRVNKDGNVSIGTTSLSPSKLDVRLNEDDNVDTVIMTGSNPGLFVPRVGIYGQSSNCSLLITDSETSIGTIGDTGCMSESLVGIKAGVYATTKLGSSAALIANSNTTVSSTDIARFQNQGSTIAVITNAGNLGIGTATPTVALDVLGSAEVSGNVGIGTTGPSSKLQVKDGDIYVETIGSGIILRSPDGSCFRVTVNTDGTFASADITCP